MSSLSIMYILTRLLYCGIKNPTCEMTVEQASEFERRRRDLESVSDGRFFGMGGFNVTDGETYCLIVHHGRVSIFDETGHPTYFVDRGRELEKYLRGCFEADDQVAVI